MIVTFTKTEEAQFNALEDKYERLIAECEAEIESLREDDLDPDGSIEDAINAKRLPEPTELRPAPIDYTDDELPIYRKEELEAYHATPEYQAYKKANDAANNELSAHYDKWEAAGSDAWKQARKRYMELIDELNAARKALYSQFEQRQFSELGNDPERIIADAKSQMELMIKNRFENAKKDQKDGKVFSCYYLRVDGDRLYIDSGKLLEDSQSLLHLHYDFFKDNEEATKAIKSIVLDVIASSPYAGTSGKLGAMVNENISTEKRQNYRTRAKAQDTGALSSIPNSLAIPTMEQYKYSMSLYKGGGAYLQPLTSTDGLKFKGGKMYFDNMQQVSEVELQNMKTKEGIENIDLALLRVFYSIILSAFEASKCTELKDVITLFVPDLAEYLGLQRNLNKQDVARVISKAQSFHNIIGVLHGTRNGKPSQSLYPVLNFEGYDDKKNTIAFSSPYMNMVIRTVYNLSIRKTKDGKPKLKKSGEPMRLVSHSYLVHSSIAKQRNKAAVENVNIIVTLIEQAGDNIPRIKASTIIERNPQFQQRLEVSTNKTQLLRTCFSKTWELLKEETDLLTAYKDIKLPDPKDPAFIPTAKTVDTIVFSFPHSGKK